jgi:DNA-directed RNA polymerase specialized sigma subunit
MKSAKITKKEEKALVETGKLTEEANRLIEENMGWAQSIARSVARSWNMDWQMDGLDGAAMEALIFCARRYEPGRGVPFKGYSRRRIHEASTEAARKSRAWKLGMMTSSGGSTHQAREVSAELFHVFPELRAGQLPIYDESQDREGQTRSSVRQLLVGASIIAAKQGISTSLPDEVVDYKRLIIAMAALEVIHQIILWEMYWEGNSMRGIASEMRTDELNVIREHQVLLIYLQKAIARGKVLQKLKVRPGLKAAALKIRKENQKGPFSIFLEAGS